MRWIFSILFIGFFFTTQAQTFQATWQKINDLPSELKESSGLVRTAKGTFW